MKIRTPIIAVALAMAWAGFGSRVQAADYAIVLKTLANPFWVSMKEGIEKEAQKQGVTVDIFASPSENDVQAQLL
jgi:D-allose transport system substrate-binding protein